MGSETRTIASGLKNLVPFENMNGLVVLLMNTKLRKFSGRESNGVIVCASNASGTAMLRPKGNLRYIYLLGESGDKLFIENDKVEAQRIA